MLCNRIIDSGNSVLKLACMNLLFDVFQKQKPQASSINFQLLCDTVVSVVLIELPELQITAIQFTNLLSQMGLTDDIVRSDIPDFLYECLGSNKQEQVVSEIVSLLSMLFERSSLSSTGLLLYGFISNAIPTLMELIHQNTQLVPDIIFLIHQAFESMQSESSNLCLDQQTEVELLRMIKDGIQTDFNRLYLDLFRVILPIFKWEGNNTELMIQIVAQGFCMVEEVLSGDMSTGEKLKDQLVCTNLID